MGVPGELFPDPRSDFEFVMACMSEGRIVTRSTPSLRTQSAYALAHRGRHFTN